MLGVGAQLGEWTTRGGRLFPRAQVARIDVKPAFEEVGQTPGLFVQGDARATVSRLHALLAERQVRGTGFPRAEVDAAMGAVLPDPPRPEGGMDARRVMRHLSGTVPAGTVYVQGCGNFMATTIPYLSLPPDSEFTCPVQFGAIGQALPCALGAAIARPGRPHLLNDGDGSLLMCLQELETAVRYGLQLVVVVSNDGGYGAEIHKLDARGFDPALAQWPSPDFVAVARALGGDGMRIEREEQAAEAVAEGFRRGGLFVVDVPLPAASVSDGLHRALHGGPNVTPLFRRVPAGPRSLAA